MAIKLINYYLFSVPVDFDISVLNIPFSRHVVVEIDVDGKQGFGEGVLYKKTIIDAEEYLKKYVYRGDEPIFDPGISEAIDEAILDAEGKLNYKFIPNYVKQVFIQKPEGMLKEVEKLISSETTQIKIKLGRNLENDTELIKNLKKTYPEFEFKADVNGGYDSQEFEKILKVNQGFIKVWEEPIKKKDRKSMIGLKNKYNIKIMLDESVQSESDLENEIQKGTIDILNIKLSRLGGLKKVEKYIEICRKNKIEISVGCNEELGVGMLTINTLASQVQNIGVEGTGSERLGFDIIDSAKKFNKNLLFKASGQKHFKIYTKGISPTFLDKINEKFYSYKAKFINFLILCKLI